MKKFLVWLFCLILLTQPVIAQSEKLIILNTNTGRDTDADTGQKAGAGEQNSSDTTENTDNVNTQQTGNVDISAPSALLMEASTGQVIYEKDADSKRPPARDIALMSRELIHTYPQIFDYCNIWMEDITHTTKKGSTQFGLTNTNKMIRQYEYATGLKTGSTSQAKFCISATARKDNTDMIAVIMAADDSKARMRDAIALLNYGFGKCQKYQEDTVKKIQDVPVKHGVEKKVGAAQMELFSYVDVTGADLSAIKRNMKLKESVTAPVRQGDKIGEVIYSLNGKEIGKVDILATEDVEEISYGSAMKEAVRGWTL